MGSPLLSTKIEENYEVVAQLLAEVCDGGIICNTEPNALRETVETFRLESGGEREICYEPVAVISVFDIDFPTGVNFQSTRLSGFVLLVKSLLCCLFNMQGQSRYSRVCFKSSTPPSSHAVCTSVQPLTLGKLRLEEAAVTFLS